MLNHDKTELLVLHAFHRPQPPLESILVCSDVIYSSNSAKNIGAWFDTVMSIDKQVNSIGIQRKHISFLRLGGKDITKKPSVFS